jgi:stearoyl-CoA desaturase (Delta-9 desaturase)
MSATATPTATTTSATTSPAGSRPARSVDAVVAKLDPVSARIKWWTAFVVMTLPAVGFGVALYLLWTGNFTATDLTLFAVMYFLHMGGITIGFHRYLAHKAFKTSRPFEAVLMVCGSLAAQGPIMYWVTTHRRHHLYSDKEGDPHSPNLRGEGLAGKLRGLWYAHMPWMMSGETSKWGVFAPDVMRDRRLFFFQRTYPLWVAGGLVLPAVVGFAVGQSIAAAFTGFVFGGLARMFLANQAAWCVGSVCHMIGGRPFENDDRSANNWPVAVLTFGEGLQNNHHAFPASYRHGVKWREPDLSGWLLALFGKVGLVWDLRSPDDAAIAKVKKRTAADVLPST